VTNVILVDVMADDATFISTHQLTPPTRYWMTAAATALRGLGLPLDNPLTFRRRGEVIRHSSIGYLLRDNTATP
jgi:hypothetical protein